MTDVLDLLKSGGCINRDKFWIADQLSDRDQYDECLTIVRNNADSISNPQLDNLLYRYCSINNYQSKIGSIENRVADICGNFNDRSWILGTFRPDERKLATRAEVAKWCNPGDPDIKAERMSQITCRCFDSETALQAKEKLDYECGAQCESSSSQPRCILPSCNTQNTTYNILDTSSTCQDVTICNIVFSGEINAGYIAIACGHVNLPEDDPEAKEWICKNSECTSSADKNCAGGGNKPDFCSNCNRDPESQECYVEMGIPCEGPDPPVQCLACKTECQNPASSACVSCRSTCYNNRPAAFCIQDEGTFCDIDHDPACCSNPSSCSKPQCCSRDLECHRPQATQSCYQEINLPCAGPEANSLWQCGIRGRPECYVNIPPRSCCAELEGELPSECIDKPPPLPDLPICYGGKDCNCDTKATKATKATKDNQCSLLMRIIILIVLIIFIIACIYLFRNHIVTMLVSISLVTAIVLYLWFQI